jgi:hypothetical protein
VADTLGGGIFSAKMLICYRTRFSLHNNGFAKGTILSEQ